MKINFCAIFLLLMLATVGGGEKEATDSEDDYYAEEEEEEEEEEDEEEAEEDEEDNRDMKFCMDRENVTEGEMNDFLVSKIHQDSNQRLKSAILCFLKKNDFFDGKSWKMEVIAEAVGKDTKMMKSIRDCLKKDDTKQEPQERTYQAQKCLLESDDDSE